MLATRLTKTKKQVLKIAKANKACQKAISIYRNFKGTNTEFANQYPKYALWICRFIPNFVDEETFLHCCEKDIVSALVYHNSKLLENYSDLNKKLCEKDLVSFKELALKKPEYTLEYFGKELLEKNYDFLKIITF